MITLLTAGMGQMRGPVTVRLSRGDRGGFLGLEGSSKNDHALMESREIVTTWVAAMLFYISAKLIYTFVLSYWSR